MTGSGFTGVTSISIGGIAATDVDVEDDETIEFFADGGPVGAQDVVVSNPYESVTLSGGFTYTGTASSLDEAELIAAAEVTLTLGQTTPPYTATVTDAGATNGRTQAPGILAEIGIGPLGLTPTYLPDSWVWFPASFANHSGSGDNYSAPLTPWTYGSYGVSFRFSNDGGVNWLYADTNGGDGALDWEDLNVIHVVP